MLVVVCALALSATPASNPTIEWRDDLAHAMSDYREQGLVLEIGRGRIHYRITRNGLHVDAGFFGFGLERLFKEDPRAMAELRRFQGLRWAGVIAAMLGTGAAIGGVGGSAVAAGSGDASLALGLVYGGAALSAMLIVMSNAIIALAPVFLSRAVAYHNDYVLGLSAASVF